MEAIVSWYLAQPTAIQSAVIALIGALTSIAVFFLGLLTIMLNAWANRRNTLKASRDEQKLQIYRDILPLIDEAETAILETSSYLRLSIASLEMQGVLIFEKLSAAPPRERYSEFLRLQNVQSEKFAPLFRFIEQWAVIDHRLKAFRLAFGSQSHAVLLATAQVNTALMWLLPADNPQGGTFPYTAPTAEALVRIRDLAETYYRENGLLSAYVNDLGKELQPVLLGHLFGKYIERRDAPDPTQFAIRLDQHEALVHHFESTEYFQRGAAMDRELRAKHGTEKRPWRTTSRRRLMRWVRS